MNTMQRQPLSLLNALINGRSCQPTVSRMFSTKESNVFKGQHVRYIPKKKLMFDYRSPEGPMALVYQASDDFYKRTQNWKLSTMIATPAAALGYFTLGAQYWWAYPILFIPTLINLYDCAKFKLIAFKNEVYKAYLYQNGD